MSSAFKPPCKDCEKRTAGCHGRCEDYLGYREARDAVNEQAYRDGFLKGYEFDSVNRAIRRRRK